MSLAGKTLFITGASRGIGLAIGLRAARDGANVAIAAKTAEPHPKLRRHHLHRSGRNRARRRQGAAARRRRPRRADGEGSARQDGGAFRRHRYRRQQCQRDFAHAGGRHRHEALRSDASDQCARHVRRLEMGNSASGKGGQSAHSHDLAAARHEGEVVRAAHRLQHRQVRHESGRARACRRTARKGIAVNALWPRTVIATAAVKICSAATH